MGYKVVTIQKPDVYFYGSHKIPSELEVIFTWSKPRLDQGNQTVTTCLLRHNLNQWGIGVSVENLNDERNEEIGMKWAYKRAITSMLKKIDYYERSKIKGEAKKEIESKFRKALWEAMNGDN